MAPSDSATSVESPDITQGIINFNNRYDNDGNSTANKIIFYDNASRYGIGMSERSLNFFNGSGSSIGGFHFYTGHIDENDPGQVRMKISGSGNVGNTSTRLNSGQVLR